MVFLQTELEAVLGTARGVPTVVSKTNTAIVVRSLSATNTIVAGDDSYFVWMVMNPRWDT
jgi:hypothetical protein